MCTIVLAWRVLADAPVAIAANRDEALDRESLPPRLLDEDPEVVAPQDAEAGGTWLGVDEHGLVVAITNRWVEPPDPEAVQDADAEDGDGGDHVGGERSRGLLVRDALARESTDEAVAFVRETVEADAYAGFNLLVVDADSARYLEWDGTGSTAGELRERDLDPGVHAIVNPGLNDADDRAARLRAELALESSLDTDEPEDPREARAWLYRAAALLGNHDYDVCVHRDGFGTRSSSLLRVGPDDRIAYAFADGPPCETDYEPVDVPASFLEGSF